MTILKSLCAGLPLMLAGCGQMPTFDMLASKVGGIPRLTAAERQALDASPLSTARPMLESRAVERVQSTREGILPTGDLLQQR